MMEKKPCLQSSPERSESGRSEMAEAPDRGWAWVVACAACMINFIIAGLGRMSGILFVAFIEIYKVDRKAASTPFSVRSSTRNLLGPVVGILGQKYGVRLVTIVGGIIGTASAAACFFADDITWITVLWGGLCGAGSALTITLPQVTIGQYFKKYRTTAAGMAFSGGCVGSFLFPVLLEQLLQVYGVQGTFLLMAAVIMHTIPAAMILKKPSWLKSAKTQIVALALPAERDETCLEGKEMENEFPHDSKQEIECPDLQFLNQNSKLVVQILSESSAIEENSKENGYDQSVLVMEACILEEMEDLYSAVQYSRGKSQFYKNLRLANENSDKEEQGLTICKLGSPSCLNTQVKIQPIPRKSNDITKNYVIIKMKEVTSTDITEIVSKFPDMDRESVLKVMTELKKLNLALSQLDLNTQPSAVVNVPEEISSNAIVDNTVNTHSNSFSDHIKTAVRLYANPLFLLICFCRAVHFVTFVPVITTVVDFVMDKGLQEQDGKWAISAMSLGDLLGRLCLGWITDYGFISLPRYMMVVMLVQGASTAALPLMHSKEMLYTGLAVFGMLQGSLFIRHPVLVSKYMGNHEQSIAMGCINFFSGLLGFGLPHYIGYFRDTIGSYDGIFYINGAFGAVIGLMWIFEPYFLKCTLRKKDQDSLTV